MFGDRVVARARLKSVTPTVKPPKEKIVEETAPEFVLQNLKSYGHMTVENRVVPDFRDGLKPVHRRILWAAHKMGIHNNFVKAVRVVADTMGSYHPHGDLAVYNSLVSMVNWPTPTFEGQGNWGDVVNDNPPAAMRYTECRLHKNAVNLILNREYIECVPMHANYDGTETQPLYLPALVPMIFLAADFGIAVGLSVRYPSFSLSSMLKLVETALRKGKKLTPKYCAKVLELDNGYRGGECTSSEEEYISMFKTSKSRITFQPTWDCSPKDRSFNIRSSAPMLDLESAMSKIEANANVMSVQNLSAKGEVHWQIVFKKTINQTEVKELATKLVEKYLVRAVTYSIAGTERRVEDPLSDETESDFFFASPIEMLTRWLDWRVWIEKEMLTRRLAKLRADLHRTNVIIHAAKNIVLLAKEISKVKQTKPLDVRVAKVLKITVDDANIILSMTVRSLSNLELKGLEEKRIEIIRRIKETKSKKAQPAISAADATRGLAKTLKIV